MWKTPELVEVKMDAEIGSYQEDYEPLPEPAFVTREVAGNEETVRDVQR